MILVLSSLTLQNRSIYPNSTDSRQNAGSPALLVIIDVPLKSGIIRTKSILQSSIAISKTKCRNSRLVMTYKSCKTEMHKVYMSKSNRRYCVQLAQVWRRIYTPMIQSDAYRIWLLKLSCVHLYLDLIWSLTTGAPVRWIPWQVADSWDYSAQLYWQLLPPLLGCQHVNFSSNRVEGLTHQ